MARNNSSNQDYTNNADGAQIEGGTVKRILKWIGANITLTGSGTNTYTMPSATDTLVGRDSVDTLTNKTISGTTNDVESASLTTTIAASAYRNGAFTYSTEADIVFDTEIFDTSSSFNTSTGIFTAPVSGYYHVSANLGTSNIGDGQQVLLRIYANGSVVALVAGSGSAAGSDPRVSTSVLTYLDAGQEIKATANSSASTAGAGFGVTFICIYFVGKA